MISLRRNISYQLSKYPRLAKILSNTGWLFLDRILRMGVGFFIGVWVARYLGPNQFGQYSFAGAFVGLFLPLATLGMDNILVRDLVREPNNQNTLLGTSFFLRFIAGLFMFVIVNIVIYIIRPDDSLMRLLVLIISLMAIFQATDVIDYWFQSQVQSRYTVFVKNIAFILVTIIKIALILNSATLLAFAYAWLAEFILGSVLLVIIYTYRKGLVFQWRLSFSIAKKILNDSWALMFAGIAIMVYVKIDQVMLGEYLGDQAVGIYSAAVRLSELWYFVPLAIVSSVSPYIINAKTISNELYKQRIQQLQNVMAILGYTIAIPISILAGTIINVVYGTEYLASSQVLVIHIWQGLFVFQGVARNIWIVTEGHYKLALTVTSIGAVLNILLNMVLIPLYGPVGSAWATVISYACADYFIFLIFPNPAFREFGAIMTKALTLKFVFSGKTLNE